MLISNEMRNEPALALRLINGKITPSRQLNEVLYSCLFLVCFSLTTKSRLIKEKKSLSKTYFLVELCYSSDLFGFFIVYTSPWQLKAQLEKLKQVRKSMYTSVAHICHQRSLPSHRWPIQGPLQHLTPCPSAEAARASWPPACSCHPCGRAGLPEGRMCESCDVIWVRQPLSSCRHRTPPEDSG